VDPVGVVPILAKEEAVALLFEGDDHLSLQFVDSVELGSLEILNTMFKQRVKQFV
jgi:hypothetical protein